MAAPQIKEKPENNILDAVRWSYETVSSMARHVKIREDLVSEYARALAPSSPDNVFDSEHHFETQDEEALAAYVLILDSINFGSGYEPFLLEEGWQLIDESLYFTLSTHLKTYFEDHGVMTATQLSQMQTDDCCALLHLDASGEKSREFSELCALSMRELGHIIMEKYEGSYLKFVKAAEGSAEKLVRQMAQMHHFNDVHEYRGLVVPFYKRAQITVADLQLAFREAGQVLFHDIETLTMFPDNAVPHVLRMDGILEYTPELQQLIDSGTMIESGSEFEVEMRACAGWVVEILAQKKNMTSMDIDHILWHRSVEDDHYTQKQPHRTLSRFY